MRTQRARLKLWMKLSTQKERVLFQFRDFHEVAVGIYARKHHTLALKRFSILVIELVAVAVAL